MLRWALLFLLVAIVAGVFGFAGIVDQAVWVARVLVVVFLVLFVAALVLGRRGPPAT